MTSDTHGEEEVVVEMMTSEVKGQQESNVTLFVEEVTPDSPAVISEEETDATEVTLVY